MIKSAKVDGIGNAPLSQDMKRSDEVIGKQPKLPGNGCCCNCCGKPPGPIDVNKIIQDGGKFIQLNDGRIVEYFVYGSEDPNAPVLLEINGSGGTGWMFKELEGITKALKQYNVKAISISVPGHGYSSTQINRTIGNWPKDDVEPVLNAEGITGNFWVEGTSYGTSHAMAVAHYFGERVEKLHLHVPYLPIEIRKEKGWKLYGADDAMKCQPDWVKSICSCRAFCCISCVCCCHKRCPGMFYDENGKKVSDGLKALNLPDHYSVEAKDVDRSAALGPYGTIHNSLIPTTSTNWGFDPREIQTKKVIISYGEDDQQSPAEHGKFLADFFTDKNDVVCKVNVGKGMGHSNHVLKMVSGEFIKQIFEL